MICIVYQESDFSTIGVAFIAAPEGKDDAVSFFEDAPIDVNDVPREIQNVVIVYGEGDTRQIEVTLKPLDET